MSDIVIVAVFCALYVSFVVLYTSYVVGYSIAKKARRKKPILNLLSD